MYSLAPNINNLAMFPKRERHFMLLFLLLRTWWKKSQWKLNYWYHFIHLLGIISQLLPVFMCIVWNINSLAPGRSECHSKNVIFNLVLLIGIFRSSHDNALSWMPQDHTDDKSTLVQVMAWCRQATSHYLSQCWLNSLLPHGVTRPQWVKTVTYTTHPWHVKLKYTQFSNTWVHKGDIKHEN